MTNPSLTLDLGLGFFVFGGNHIPHSCYYGMTSFYGVHDGAISDNTVGWVQVPIAGALAIALDLGGNYRVAVEANTLAGADGTLSRGISVGDTPSVDVLSNYNVIRDNHVNEVANDFQGLAYSLTGSANTDCAYYQTQCTGVPAITVFFPHCQREATSRAMLTWVLE